MLPIGILVGAFAETTRTEVQPSSFNKGRVTSQQSYDLKNFLKNLSSAKSPYLHTQGEKRGRTFCVTEGILTAIHWPSFVEIREIAWPGLVEAPVECLLKSLCRMMFLKNNKTTKPQTTKEPYTVAMATRKPETMGRYIKICAFIADINVEGNRRCPRYFPALNWLTTILLRKCQKLLILDTCYSGYCACLAKDIVQATIWCSASQYSTMDI